MYAVRVCKWGEEIGSLPKCASKDITGFLWLYLKQPLTSVVRLSAYKSILSSYVVGSIVIGDTHGISLPKKPPQLTVRRFKTRLATTHHRSGIAVRVRIGIYCVRVTLRQGATYTFMEY